MRNERDLKGDEVIAMRRERESSHAMRPWR